MLITSQCLAEKGSAGCQGSLAIEQGALEVKLPQRGAGKQDCLCPV